MISRIVFVALPLWSERATIAATEWLAAT